MDIYQVLSSLIDYHYCLLCWDVYLCLLVEGKIISGLRRRKEVIVRELGRRESEWKAGLCLELRSKFIVGILVIRRGLKLMKKLLGKIRSILWKMCLLPWLILCHIRLHFSSTWKMLMEWILFSIPPILTGIYKKYIKMLQQMVAVLGNFSSLRMTTVFS